LPNKIAFHTVDIKNKKEGTHGSCCLKQILWMDGWMVTHRKQLYQGSTSMTAINRITTIKHI